MSLNKLRRNATKNARSAGVSAFKQFIQEESVTLNTIWNSLSGDEYGKITISLLDRFGVFLAFRKGKNGEYLSSNTVIQYFRQFKWFLLQKYPERTALVDKALLVKSKQLLRYCKLRSVSVYTKQANAVTKQDLLLLIKYLFSTASTPLDYQDACLLMLMWYTKTEF